ncbi:MAG: ATP-binding protein [Gemmatimonadaceae bacterium]
MISRIVVTGSECTGKTTLSRQLAQELGALWLPEYARAYAESVGRPLTASDVEPIAHGQIAMEDAAARSRPTITVLDTDLVSTVVYARHYYGSCPPSIVELARARLAPLYLLCDFQDIPWVADAVRDQPQSRLQVHEQFRETLREFGAQIALITGVGFDRLRRGLHAIEAVEPRTASNQR